jgi:hypothetical protein
VSIRAKSLKLLVICLDLFRESIVGERTAQSAVESFRTRGGYIIPELSVMLNLVLEISELLDDLLALR